MAPFLWSDDVNRELIGTLKLKMIFDSDFKYIFICRACPSHYPALQPRVYCCGEALESVSWPCFVLRGRACNPTLFETGQEEGQ